MAYTATDSLRVYPNNVNSRVNNAVRAGAPKVIFHAV